MCHRLDNELLHQNKIFLLMKKTNQFENEITSKINDQNKSVPIYYGDRFIPRRHSLKNRERNLKFASIKPAKDVLSLCTNKDFWRENNYLPMINYVMEMSRDHIIFPMDPIVKLDDFIGRTYRQEDKANNWFLFDWPCRPRTKPYVSLDSTFDLPEHGANYGANQVDWSIKGHIAVSLDHDVIIWQSKEDLTMSFDIKFPRSLAYSPNGELLAIGCRACDYPVLELWDVSLSQDFYVVCGKVFNRKHVDIQCIQWDSSGKQVVCGTHYGCIYVLSIPALHTINKIQQHQLPITLIRFSPTMRYLACGDFEGNIVVYNWNICSVYLYVRSRRKRNVTFDWHPWSGVDLAISEHIPASILILHVPSKKIVAYYQKKKSDISINYISFSKLTGELLVSISKQDGIISSDFEVLVMSSLDTVVDILKTPDGGARFLMWSPDGTRVATTNNDEDLSLWNFYSLKKTKCFKKHNETNKNYSSGDLSSLGSQFRKWCFLK